MYRLTGIALSAFIIASSQPASAQSLSAAQLQVYYERCLITVLTYEAELKELNNRISFVDNGRQIAGLGSLPWNNPNEAMRKQADELYDRLSIDLADLRKRVSWLLTYRKIEKKSCAFYEALMLEARGREKGGGPIAGGGNSVIEHEKKEKEFKRKLNEAKEKIGHIEKDLDELERIRALARSLQPIPPRPPPDPPTTSATGNKGGGPSKGVLIGGGAALLGGLVAIGGGGGGQKAPNSGSSATGPAPTVSFTTIPGGVGIAGFTVYTFTASGTAISYEWTFADGGTGTGQTVTHMFRTVGTSAVTLIGRGNGQSATATGPVTVARDMTGSWAGPFNNRDSVLTFFPPTGGTATELPLTGTYADQFSSGSLGGSLVGSGVCPCDVRFSINLANSTFDFVGQRVDENRMVGSFQGSGFNTPTTLTRR